MCRTKRPDWDEFFLEVAETYAKRGTCERLKVGSVIVKNNKQVGQGYNGSIQGHEHCSDEGVGCLLNEEGRCIRTLHAFCLLKNVYDNVYDYDRTLKLVA